PHPPRSTPFPYTTLFRSTTSPSELEGHKLQAARNAGVRLIFVISNQYNSRLGRYRQILATPSVSTKVSQSKRTNVVYISPRMAEDRKSTRLNSSHVKISY